MRTHFNHPCLYHLMKSVAAIIVCIAYYNIKLVFMHICTSVVADTCVAMDEWVQNPTAHTALDEILPCVDNATAQETLLRTRDVTHQLVNLVDNIVSNVTNRNLPPAAVPLYYNQSGPLMPRLCNPFNSDLTNRSCADGEVSLDNAAEVRDYLRFLKVNLYPVNKSLARHFLAGPSFFFTFFLVIFLAYNCTVNFLLLPTNMLMSLDTHCPKLGCEKSRSYRFKGLAP